MEDLNYKTSEEDDRNRVFKELRARASALRNAKARSSNLQVWNPATREGTSHYRENITRYGKDIGAVLTYFDNAHSSALDTICHDEFVLEYQVHGDIGREVVYGENTLSIFTTVTWELCEVSVILYPDLLTMTMPREKITTAAREGIPDRDQVAKSTGWSRDAVRQIGDEDLSLFKVMLSQVTVGQSKVTRLVKGFLLLLECMEKGELTIDLEVKDYVTYAPAPVLNSFRDSGRAYVYNSRPTSHVHTAVLHRMCGSYPPPEIDSHVSIPSDGERVYMVMEGRRCTDSLVTLTPNLIYASIMMYAMDVSCTSVLQEALIIACSLQQNRYFSRVKLPKVASQFDLMVPAFVANGSKLDKPILSLNMSKSLGRIHQMLMFSNIKDLISAAEFTTKRGFSAAGSIRAFMGSQASLMSQMASHISPLGLLEATKRMKVHECLDEADFSDLASIPIFEGLWLCQDAISTVKNGVIMPLVRGSADMDNRANGEAVLARELNLAGVSYDRRRLPRGVFTVSWVCTGRPAVKKQFKTRRGVTSKIKLTHECDDTPGDVLRTSGRKKRISKKSVSSNGSSPVATVAASLPDKPFGQAMPQTPPPRYKSPSSSSSSSFVRTLLAEEAKGALAKRTPIEEVTEEFESPDTSSADVLSTVSPQAGKKRVTLGEVVRETMDHRTTVDIERIVGNTISQLTSEERVLSLDTGTAPRFTRGEAREVAKLLDSVDMSGVLVDTRTWYRLLKTLRLTGKLAAVKLNAKWLESPVLEGLYEVVAVSQGLFDKAGVSTQQSVRRLLEVSNLKLNNAESKALGEMVTDLRVVMSDHHIRNIDDLVEILEQEGDWASYTGEGMPGNSKLAKRFRFRIGTQSRRSTLQTDLKEMENKRKDWAGRVEDSDNRGVKYIVNSSSWANFCSVMGIPIDETTRDGKLVHYSIANCLSSMPEGTNVGEVITTLYQWVTGTESCRIPSGLTQAEVLSIGMVEPLTYRDRPASFGKREFVQEDSKYIVVASRLDKEYFNLSYLKEATAVFFVPPHMQGELRRVYGLFARK